VIRITNASEADSAAIATIYNHYVATTAVTFETEPVDAVTMAQRVAQVQQHQLPWLVLYRGDTLSGYAYATKWRERAAYQHSVEVSVYLAPEAVGQGFGMLLYQHLFARLDQLHIHAIMAGIALPNTASIALHEKFGLKKVAHFAQVGRKFGQWLDVGYWQLVVGDQTAEITK